MKRAITFTVRLFVAAPLFAALGAGWAHAADAPDAWLTMKTTIALITAEGVSTSGLQVDSLRGVVTLQGNVSTESDRARAEAVARRVDGVQDVKNLLLVVPGSAKPVVERRDDAVKDAVVAAFKADSRVNRSGINVQSVNKGVVLLAGSTDSLQTHLDAVKAAQAVPGVKRVATEVQVTAGTE